MIGIAPQEWKTDLPEFCEKTRDFYAGKMDKGSYKGFSGRYGSYAQKGGAASMLRLRMTAGCVSKEKLAFIAKAIRAYQVNMVHFTTCESVQFHNLDEKSVCELMEQALDAGIVTMGRELGTMFESEIPSFLVKLGKEIAARGLDFESYRTQYPDGIEKAAAEYLA